MPFRGKPVFERPAVTDSRSRTPAARGARRKFSMSTQKGEAKKVVVFGLDSADPDVMLDMISKGALPTFERFLKEGVFSRLASTFPAHSGPAWTAFSTGLGPARSGVYCFMTQGRDTYTYRSVFSKDIRADFFWEIAGRAGARPVVLNVPITFPPRETNGIIVSGYPDKETRSIPDGIRNLYPDFIDFDIPSEFLWMDNMCRTHIATDLKRMCALEKLAAPDEHQLAVAIFNFLDRAQHRYWCTFDTSHPAYIDELPPSFKDFIPACYRLADRMMARIMAHFGDDAVYVVVSDHGHEGVTRAFNLYQILLENRLIVPLEEYCKDEHYQMNTMIDTRRSLVYDSAPSLMRLAGLNFNVKGREPHGIVNQKDFNRLREAVIDVLENTEDPETGKKVFSKVFRREELLDGTRGPKAPDILAQADEHVVFTIPCMSTYFAPITPPLLSTTGTNNLQFTGGHAPHGVFLALGPGIKKAGPEDMAPAMTDVAPTILEMFGLQHDDMDGRPIPVFSAPAPLIRPLSSAASHGSGAQDAADTEITPEDEQNAIDHLKGMGYL